MGSSHLDNIDSLNKSIAFKVSNLTKDHIEKLGVDEIRAELNDLHEALFKCSSVNFSGNTTAGDDDDNKSVFSSCSSTRSSSSRGQDYRNPKIKEEGKYIKES